MTAPTVHHAPPARSPRGQLTWQAIKYASSSRCDSTAKWRNLKGPVTVACCQDIGESAAGLRDPKRTTPSGHGGFVEYYRGYAWLKMPLHDGKKLLNTLLDTAFHDRVTIRWQPGSWRMHVPLVHDDKNSIDLAHAAQIYFPGKQIPELTAILTGLSGIVSVNHPDQRVVI